MSRSERKKSTSGIYHIMIRGNEQRDLYIDDEDRMRFLQTLEIKTKEGNYKLLAYCLMDNHVHILIKEFDKKISELIKKIGASYVYYFNKKYERVGHLFQDRFKSEEVETESYLLSVVRYIHKNPVKAGMVKHEKDYRWSSYNEYIGCNTGTTKTEINFVLGIFSKDIAKAVKLFIEFSKQNEEVAFLDVEEKKSENTSPKITKQQAERYVADYLKTKKLKKENIKLRMFINERNELILYLKNNTNMTIREIGEMLEVNRGMVERVK